MALTTLLFKKRPGKIGALELDVTITENHAFNTTVTKFPIEKGADITDHIINDPVKLSMIGFITNSPVRIFGGVPQNLEAGLKAIPNRVQNAFSQLLALRDSKKLFTVVTGLEVYKDMFFESLVFPRDRTTGEALRFTSTLTSLAKAESEIIESKNLDQGSTSAKENVKDLAPEKVDKGADTTSTPTPEQGKRASLLYRAFF